MWKKARTSLPCDVLALDVSHLACHCRAVPTPKILKKVYFPHPPTRPVPIVPYGAATPKGPAAPTAPNKKYKDKNPYNLMLVDVTQCSDS